MGQTGPTGLIGQTGQTGPNGNINSEYGELYYNGIGLTSLQITTGVRQLSLPSGNFTAGYLNGVTYINSNGVIGPSLTLSVGSTGLWKVDLHSSSLFNTASASANLQVFVNNTPQPNVRVFSSSSQGGVISSRFVFHSGTGILSLGLTDNVSVRAFSNVGGAGLGFTLSAFNLNIFKIRTP
jgi:hypothetical protein